MIAEWSEWVSPADGLVISNYSVYALDDPGDLLPIEKVTCNGEVSRVTLVDPIDTGRKYVLKADGIRDMVGNMSHTSGHFGYMADMSVSGLSAYPDHLTDGSTPIDISFTLENTGNFEADSFTVSFWLKTVDDGLEEEYLLGRVAFEEFPDSSSLVDTIHVLPPAEAVEENYIVARVDDEGLIVEWDEENN
ncbi:MAG TPA: CARDB domain-containing protein, partial [Candidatus Krumholzibacterium sp.]|nr:CARDB domain-containing protein [Candidatus Krumholzibacterium sp.]